MLAAESLSAEEMCSVATAPIPEAEKVKMSSHSCVATELDKLMDFRALLVLTV
ncbi:hypothetical protein ACRRTK_024147 [Alexandromys fortis]